MELPDFELGPLELEEVADSEPAIAPASARVKFEGDWYLLRECTGRTGHLCLFFRLDLPDAPVLSFTDSRTLMHINSLIEQGDARLPSLFEDVAVSRWEEELPPLIRRMLDSKFYFRRLLFDAEKPPVMQLGLSCDGGRWMLAGANQLRRNYAPDFSWPSSISSKTDFLLRMTDEQIVEAVEDLHTDPASESLFALHWAQKSWHEQVSSIARFKNGDQNEMMQVMRWMTRLCVFEVPEEWPVRWGVALSHSSANFQSQINSRRLEYMYSLETATHDNKKLELEVEEWLKIIHSYFSPAFDSSIERFPVIKQTLQNSGFWIQISVDKPTQHERLEARLCLREWLAKNGLPALLGDA